MAASPSTVLTRGIGSWGATTLILTRGLGIGSSAAASYSRPQFSISRQHVATLSIEREHVETLSVARKHVGTLEVGSG